MELTVAPYGTWPSPLSAADLATGSVMLEDLQVDGAGGVLWLQSDPADGGRVHVWRHTADAGPRRISPEGFSCRTRVHEYGGGALGAGHGVILAASWDDQRLHRLHDDGTTTPVTPAPQTPAGIRWQTPRTLPGGRAFVAVRETHGPDRPRANTNVHGGEEAVNELVHVDLDDGRTTVLVSGPDFVGGPWLSPSGRRIAWLQWDHPHMPWDAAELWVATLADELIDGGQADGGQAGEGLRDRVHVAGGPAAGPGGTPATVHEACWVDEERLLLTEEPEGWANISLWQDGVGLRRLQDEPVEAGVVRWMPTVDRLVPRETPDGLAVDVAVVDGGTMSVRRLLPGAGRAEIVPTPRLTTFQTLLPHGEELVTIAGGPAESMAVRILDPETGATTILSTAPPAPATVVGAAPQHVTFPTRDGADAHAQVYAPTSQTHVGPADELPPLIVLSHGGPTGRAQTGLNPTAQYWASRGFAVADVDYRGSAGYGREYRDALQGRWGILDVADCVDAARHLAEQGLVDGDRLIIEGGSAGGYTTLLALCTTDVFAAGGSSYGVADLRALARDTHKFESRYLDGLVGEWPADEDVYVERSPISHVDRLRTPMIVLQGAEDAVVPPAQAEMIVASLREKGITHAYLLFEGEQHGFRKPAHIRRALEARLAFYGRVLGFTPADDPPLPELVEGR